MKLWKIMAVLCVCVPTFAQVQLGRNVQIGASGNQLAMRQQVIAGPGQYVVVYPTTVASGVTLGDTTYKISPGAPGGQIFMGYAGGVFDCFGLARCEGHLIWSGFSLPAYVNPANVTSVVPFAIYSTNNGFADSVITVSPAGASMPNSAGAAFKMGQTSGGTGTTGAQVSSTSLSWEVGDSAGIPGPTYLNVASIGLIVYYIGPAPPINNDIQVISPLYFNQSTFMLGIDPFALSYSNSLTVGTLGPASRSTGEVIPVNDGTGTSDCTAGGGSTVVWCYSNGTAWSAFGGGGGSGSISGQTAGYAVEAATATTATGPFPMDDSVTAAATVTVHKKLAVASTSDPSQISLTYNAGHAPVPAAGSAVYAADTSGNAQVSENGTAVSRICTAGNGVCAPGTGTVTSVSVTTANGVSGSVATATTTPAITLSLGAITPTSTNGVSAATMAFVDPTSSIQTQLNGKQQALTLTTTGTSGAATLTGGALNIPNYATGGGGNTTSTSLTTNSLPKANGANSIINSLFTDNGTGGAYTGTGGFSATAFLGTGSDHYLNIPSSPSHTPAISDLYNNAGTLIWCPSGSCVNLYPLGLTSLAAQAADTVVQNASGSSAAPTAVAIPTCSGGTNALNYNTSTHAWSCNTISLSYQPSALPVPPAVGSFTWVNQGTATTSNNGSVIQTIMPSAASLNWRILKVATPGGGTPWSVAGFIKFLSTNNASQLSGLYLTDGTKLLGIEFIYSGGATQSIRVEHITNTTTDGSTVFTQNAAANTTSNINVNPASGVCYRWRDDGSTLYADYSVDCANWVNLYSEAVGSFITPTAYGFGGINASSGATEYFTLAGWYLTNSAAL